MQAVFQTNLLPLISSKDKKLLFRITTNLKQLLDWSPCYNCNPYQGHVQQMDYNAHTVFYMGYLDDDPRIIFLVEQEFALFHTVSLNTFCKICVLPHWRARGKPSYPISILICTDLAIGSVAFIPMDDAKMGAI